MPKRIIVSVTNDMSTDNRVDKTCRSLLSMGFDVEVVCRNLKNSLLLDRPYKVNRMKLLFNSGPLFYAEINIRIFFFLLFRKADVLLSNDLDTLLANYLGSKIKRSKLVYDSHEYFTEVPELEGRMARSVWLRIESWIFPKLKYAYTVNQSIADIYSSKYNVGVRVIRNLPNVQGVKLLKSRKELALPEKGRIVVLQGAGINVKRGAEEAVQSMTLLDEQYFLLIVGAGDAMAGIKKLVVELKLEKQVFIRPRMPYEEMMEYTSNADLGISLDKGNSGNYQFSLPNKLFDYMAAGLPVLVSNLKEVKAVVEKHEIGLVINQVNPEEIANGIRQVFENDSRRERWKANSLKASELLNWSQEEQKLIEIYKDLV